MTYKLSDGRLLLKSSHSAALPPSESLTRLRFTSVVSGSGVLAIAAKQPRGDRGQKMSAAARGEEADFFRRQRHEVLIGGRHILEWIAAQHLLDALLRRVRIVNEINFRLRRGIAGKGVVQQDDRASRDSAVFAGRSPP